MAAGLGFSDVDWPRALVGLAVFCAPGAAWTWAWMRDAAAWRVVPVALVVAFSLEPLTMLVLNLVFGFPVTVATGVYLSAGLALLGVAVGLRPRLARATGA